MKDRDAVAEAISDASKESLQIFASLLSDFASEFRVMVALNPNDKHIDLWEVRWNHVSCFNYTKNYP